MRSLTRGGNSFASQCPNFNCDGASPSRCDGTVTNLLADRHRGVEKFSGKSLILKVGYGGITAVPAPLVKLTTEKLCQNQKAVSCSVFQTSFLKSYWFQSW